MKNKISTLQVVSLCWQLILSVDIGIISYISLISLKQDGWISIIVAGFLGIIPVLLYLYLMSYRPEMNFHQLNEYLFGKIGGKIINSIVALLIAFCVMLYFNNLNNFITSQYLHKTPTLFGIIIFSIPVIYLLNQGLTTIGRTTFVLFAFGLGLLLLTVLGLVGQIDLNNFMPILEHDTTNIFRTALRIIPYTSFSLILLLCIPKQDIVDSSKLNKRVIGAYIISFITVLSALFFIVGVLGADLAQLYQYPEFHVLKRISIGGFIERVESTLSLRWIFYIFTTLVFGLYFLKKYIETTFRIKKEKKLNIISSVVAIILLISCNWMFSSNTESNMLLLNIIPIFLYIINLGVTILMFIKTKTKTL
ncbi:MAG: hypothetical protein E7173_03635 [Firmicutes bacterium]|nr:hypothetical protein [Bacillota bacterium]